MVEEKNIEIMNYAKIRSRLQTGDIVLFSGNGFISKAIKLVDRSNWSHIGIVLRLHEYDSVLLWESTTLSKIKDLDSGLNRKGVQIVPLSQRLKDYDGDVAVRILNADRTQEMLNQVMIFRSESRMKDYELNRIELIKAAYDGPFGENKEDLTSLFCSELVAECYQRMGLLYESKPSNEYTPGDFSTENNLYLNQDAFLDSEIYLEIK